MITLTFLKISEFVNIDFFLAEHENLSIRPSLQTFVVIRYEIVFIVRCIMLLSMFSLYKQFILITNSPTYCHLIIVPYTFLNENFDQYTTSNICIMLLTLFIKHKIAHWIFLYQIQISPEEGVGGALSNMTIV